MNLATRAYHMAAVYGAIKDNPHSTTRRQIQLSTGLDNRAVKHALESLEARGVASAEPHPKAWGARWSVTDGVVGPEGAFKRFYELLTTTY